MHVIKFQVHKLTSDKILATSESIAILSLYVCKY